MAFVIAIHVTACIGLIIIVLIQSGRGGGLVENLSSLESVFGTKTNAFLTRATTVLSVIFFVTCLSLAALSIRQSRSLMQNIKLPAPSAAEDEAKEGAAQKTEDSVREQPKTEALKPEPATKEMPKAE